MLTYQLLTEEGSYSTGKGDGRHFLFFLVVNKKRERLRAPVKKTNCINAEISAA